MVTSASSGPRAQSLGLVGGIGSAVGGGGTEVLVGTGSVGVGLEFSTGGVLVLVGSSGEADGVGEVHPEIAAAVMRVKLISRPTGIHEKSLLEKCRKQYIIE